MDKKEEKRIRAIIPDGSIWFYFLEHIKSVHGKTYGYIGVEVQNALKQYVENYEKPDIQDMENKYQRKIQELQDKYESEINTLKIEIENLKGLKEKHDQLQNNHDKLRNKYDHLQERLNKSQNELNMLERETRKLHVVIAKIEKLSFFERVLNRLPSEVKQLTTNEDDLL